MSPLTLTSIVTLSGSHAFPGATVAVSGLESALAVVMMVCWYLGPHPRRVERYRLDVRTGRLLIRMRAASPVVVRGA